LNTGNGVPPPGFDQEEPEAQMRDSDEYRRHAQECIILAAQTKDPDHKAQVLKIVDAWIALAEEAERREGRHKETPSAS
jgi:hypothetical protein